MVSAVFSLVLIALAGAVAFQGLAFARLGAMEWEMERRGDGAAPAPDALTLAAQAAGQREALAPWLNEWGLRDKARLLSFSLGRALDPPAPTGLAELAAVLEVDPVRSASWIDLAELTWPDLARRPTAMAAWELSRLTGPYEYAEMLRRTQFLARRWMFAGPESRRHFIYDVTFLRRFPDPFLASWQRLVASLPAAQRRALFEELQPTAR